MRGSVYYQTAVLSKLIFFEGAKKKSDRINPNYEHYGCISSLKRWIAIEMFGITFF